MRPDELFPLPSRWKSDEESQELRRLALSVASDAMQTFDHLRGQGDPDGIYAQAYADAQDLFNKAWETPGV